MIYGTVVVTLAYGFDIVTYAKFKKKNWRSTVSNYLQPWMQPNHRIQMTPMSTTVLEAGRTWTVGPVGRSEAGYENKQTDMWNVGYRWPPRDLFQEYRGRRRTTSPSASSLLPSSSPLSPPSSVSFPRRWPSCCSPRSSFYL